MRPFALLIAIALVATAGCASGSDEADPQARQASAAVNAYTRGVFTQDFAGACERLAPAAQRDAVAYIRKQLPRANARTCVHALQTFLVSGAIDYALSGVTDLERAQRKPLPPKMGASAVTVRGSTASGSVEGSHKEVRLRKVGGMWTISRLRFAAQPSGG